MTEETQKNTRKIKKRYYYIGVVVGLSVALTINLVCIFIIWFLGAIK